MIILMRLGEEDKLQSSSFCSFLQSLFDPNVFSASSFQTPSVYVPPLMSDTKIHTRTQPYAKLHFCMLIGHTQPYAKLHFCMLIGHATLLELIMIILMRLGEEYKL
jgi:hypothetical protein